jgi:hypothetical protein
VLGRAIAQIPAKHRKKVLVTRNAGCTTKTLVWLHESTPLDQNVRRGEAR